MKLFKFTILIATLGILLINLPLAWATDILDPLERLRGNDTITGVIEKSGLPSLDVNPSNRTADNLQMVIANIIMFVLTLVGVLFVTSIAYAGFSWMTSEGNRDKVDKAKKRLVYSTLGVLLIFASYSLVAFAENTLYKATCTDGQQPAVKIHWNILHTQACPQNRQPTGECRSNIDCHNQMGSDRWMCNDGSCKFLGYCQADGDCPRGYQCHEDLCLPECQTDDDCSDGYYCWEQYNTCYAIDDDRFNRPD